MHAGILNRWRLPATGILHLRFMVHGPAPEYGKLAREAHAERHQAIKPTDANRTFYEEKAYSFSVRTASAAAGACKPNAENGKEEKDGIEPKMVLPA